MVGSVGPQGLRKACLSANEEEMIMKTLILAAALLTGTAAMAQTDPAAPAPAATMAQPDATAPAPSGGAMSQPDQSAPTPPATPTDQSAMPASGGAMSQGTSMAQADTSSYPPCSRTVTDKCVQTGHGGGHGRTMKRHHKA